MTPIFSPAPPLSVRPFDSLITFDSPPPLHQPYFLLTSPSDLSLFTDGLKGRMHSRTYTHTHTHTHVYLYLLSAYVPDCNPAPQRWIKAEGVMMVSRERMKRRWLNCERDREEWGRLQFAGRRDRGRYKEKERETFASIMAPTGSCCV